MTRTDYIDIRPCDGPSQGRMQDFSGGGPNFKICRILNIHCREQRISSEPLLGGFGGMLPQ